MDIFDRKPILTRCTGHNCHRNATTVVVSRSSVVLSWWCDQCSPTQDSNIEDKARMICTYRDALNYVSRYCRNRTSDYQDLIQAFAKAKGLGTRIGKDEAQEFFCPVPPENRFPDLPKRNWEDLIF